MLLQSIGQTEGQGQRDAFALTVASSQDALRPPTNIARPYAEVIPTVHDEVARPDRDAVSVAS